MNLDDAFDGLHRDLRHGPANLGDTRARVMAAIDAELADTQARSQGAEPDAGPSETLSGRPVRRAQKRLRRHVIVPVAAAAAAAGIAIAAVQFVPGDPGVPAASTAAPVSSAAEVLDHAADRAVQTGAALKPRQFRYIRQNWWVTEDTGPAMAGHPAGGWSYRIQWRYDTWIPADYRQTWQEQRTAIGQPTLLGASVPPSLATAPPGWADPQGTRFGSCGNFFHQAKPQLQCADPRNPRSPEHYAAWPRDPAELDRYLTKKVAPLVNATHGTGTATLAGAKFDEIVLDMQTTTVPPDLRAALYRVLATVPGMRVLRTSVDVGGRTGTAVGFDDGRQVRQVIVGNDAGAFLGMVRTASAHPEHPWIQPGTVLERDDITTGVVDRIGQVPAS